MKRWILATGMAMMTLPILATADTGTTKGYASPQSTCSTGQSCDSCAQPCQTGCCAQSCCGTWELEGQALYWRRCADDEIYGLVTVNNGSNTEQNWKTIRPDNDWGVRVKGKYTTCDGCRFASLSYLYFDETDHARAGNVTNPYFTATLDGLVARVKSEYQRLDGRLGHYICSGCKGGFYGYGGISWVYIREHDRLDGAQNTTQVFLSQRSSFSAAGFEAGVGGHYKICGGFGLAAELGGVAALGERQFSIEYNDVLDGGFFRSTYPSVTTCLSGLDMKLEAFYECCWCGLDWGLMFGYEQHYYLNALRLNPLYASTITATQRPARLRDFAVGGLYFGAKVGY